MGRLKQEIFELFLFYSIHLTTIDSSLAHHFGCSYCADSLCCCWLLAYLLNGLLVNDFALLAHQTRRCMCADEGGAGSPSCGLLLIIFISVASSRMNFATFLSGCSLN